MLTDITSANAKLILTCSGVELQMFSTNQAWNADALQVAFVIRIDDPGASVRVNRESPTISLWYTYGGGVNRLEIASTAIL